MGNVKINYELKFNKSGPVIRVELRNSERRVDIDYDTFQKMRKAFI